MKPSIVRNALLLTGANLVMRGVSMLFQVWLADTVGAAGIGLLQLIMTVNGLAITLGMSGIRTAAMYLSAEEYGHRRLGGVRQAMSRCLVSGFLLSSLVGALLTVSAPRLAQFWIKDLHAIASLRLLGLTLPLTCLSAILAGYFTACGKIRRLVAVELGDRLLTVILTAALLRHGPTGDLSFSCLSIVGGNAHACFASTSFLLLMLLADFRTIPASASPSMGKRLTRLCLPLALNDYLRSGLGTLEQFLIPNGLSRSGQSREQAMSAYGTIHGMVFPVLMFPSTVLFALADLLVPELARSRAESNHERIDHLIGTCLRMGGLYAAVIAGLLYTLAVPLGHLIYGSADAGRYLQLFSPLVVMLYLDCIVDGIHKGMGQQVYCVRINTLTSFLDVAMLFFLLPRMGIDGYFLSFLVTHAINFYFSLHRLLQLTQAPFPSSFFLRSALCVAAAAFFTGLLMPANAGWSIVIVCSGVYLALLALLLLVCGVWQDADHRLLCRLFRSDIDKANDRLIG